ncbi:SpoIIE family protein phosphatase [Streptomyces sp. NPDC021749]|uniref:SpoIIE family protein phosphatase n=1 Tax=Streptomyces sp. NPDC021749 TaxID=3154905 RepID=UPI0033EF3FA8
MLLDAPLVQAVQEAEASAGLVFLLPPGDSRLHLTVMTGISQRIVAPWERMRLAGPVPVSDAVRERRLVWVAGHEDMARRYPRAALALPYAFAVAAAPITADGAEWGGLALLWPGSHPPELSPREHDGLRACCHHLGLLLQHAADTGHPVLPGPEPRIIPALRTRAPGTAEALAAFDFAERLPEGCCALDLDGRITFITATAAELVGATVAELRGALPWEALPWLHDPVFEDHYRAAVISRQPESFTALRPPDRWLSFHLHPDAGGLSVLITPAATDRLTDRPADRSTAPDLPAAGSRHSRPAAPAAAGRADVLYHLLHLAAALTEAVGVQDVTERVANQIMPAFGIQALALTTAVEGRLRIVGHRGFTDEVLDRFEGLPLTADTPVVRVLSSGVPSFFGTFEDLRRAYPDAVLHDDTAAWAFLPLIASGAPVGSLVLAYDRPFPWGPQERAMLTSLAGLVAQALDRALLYDTKHRLARSLQAGLLPTALPRIPGLDVAARYLPAGRVTDIGGDFYDLIRLGDRAAAAAIGDVQGHNVNAAALMGQVRTAVHATAGAPPGEVLARTNRLLTDLDAGLLTSCLYVHLDLAEHRARMASAGHPPPLLRHPDGHTEILTLPPGLLLGIDPDTDYPTTEITLRPGSVLALYTDGLVEAPGGDIEEEIADLAGHLARSGPPPMETLADELLRRAGLPSPLHDDVALLLIAARADDGGTAAGTGRDTPGRDRSDG